MSVDPSPPHLNQLDPRELGGRLKAARRARGFTQAEAAKHLGVARTTLTAMEAGEREVQPGELAKLAGLYGRSIGELVQREEPAEPFSVQLRSTLRPGMDPESLRESIFEFQRLCEDYLSLEQFVGAPLGPRYSQPYDIDLEKPERSAEDIANRERQRLGLGDGPALNLRSILESDVSLRVFYMDLPSDVAAMFAYGAELGGCIAVNRNHPAERRRQSQAHEYGHFLTDRYRPRIALLGRYQRVPANERFAEAFGRAFLLPATGVTRRLNDLRRTKGGGLTAADLCLMAHLFFVSVEAMTRRLEELDLVPIGTWDRLHTQGFRVREAQALLGLAAHPVTDQPLPVRYLYLAAEAYAKGELSEGQLARYLRMERADARRTMADLGSREAISAEGEVGQLGLDLSLGI